MGVVSLEMGYRNDVSINQPFSIVALGCVYSDSFIIARLGASPCDPLIRQAEGGCEALLPQGSFSGALP